MCVIRWFLLKSCIFGIYFLATDASVSLQTFDGGNAYLKDSAVTLVCNITPYNNEMTWYVDNDPYAGCFLGICAPSANKPYTFKFTFDETAGLFNLTIDTVNYSHTKLSFACDDGNVRETISFNVTTDKEQNNYSASNNVTSTLSTKPAINIPTSGTGSNFTAVPPSISSVSILLKNNEQNGSERSNGGNGDIGAIVGGSVAGGVGVIGAASLMGIAGYKRYKKYTKRKEIEKKCNIEAPTLTECTETSTQIALSWTQPYWNGNAPLEYNVVLNQDEPYKTDKTSYTIHDLIPGKAYTVKVYTLCEGLISLPLERTVTTPAVTVSQEDVCFEPAESCVKCNIKWTVRDFVKPKPFKESDKFDYNVICYLGKKIVHASKTIKELNYTVPGLHPESSYEICVNAFYHSEKLEPPCKIEIEAPYKPSNLEASAQSNLIDLEWEKPVYTGDQKLDYEVTCDGVFKGKTNNTTYRIGDCIPGKRYEIKIFTIINGIKSLPSVKNVRTQPSQPKELPPLKVGQLKALPMEMSNSVQFVTEEEGFAQNHSNRNRRNNAVNVLKSSTD